MGLYLNEKSNIEQELDINSTIVFLIGISNYQGEGANIGTLPSAFNDVAELVRVFKDKIKIPKTKIHPIIDVSKNELIQKFYSIIKNNPLVENIFIHFSGRSYFDEKDKKLRLLCADSVLNESLLNYYSFSLSDLKQILSESKIKNIIIFLDCDQGEKVFDDFRHDNIFIMTATGKKEKAIVDPSFKMGFFTKEIVNILDNIKSNESKITLLYVYKELIEKFNNSIIPSEPKVLNSNLAQHLILMKNEKRFLKKVQSTIDIEDIVQLIRVDRMKEAFELSLKLSKNDNFIKNDITLLNGRFNKIERSRLLGIVSLSEHEKEMNQIREALLLFINKVKN